MWCATNLNTDEYYLCDSFDEAWVLADISKWKEVRITFVEE
jgi:hypothetical protein